MNREIKYKLQGNGSDSWEISEYNDKDELMDRYMVYDNPDIKPIPNVDVIGLLNKLREENPQDFEKLKQLLNN